MPQPTSATAESLALLLQQLDELYRMQAEQAARLAALEGEFFLLKHRLECQPPPAGRSASAQPRPAPR